MNHPALLSIEELLAQCEVRTTKGSGPGGQHRNKTESAIVITHLPTGIVGQASERRSQHENRKVAIERLRIRLALAIRSPFEEDGAPSELWRSRQSGKQIHVSESHVDFPAILTEVLNHLEFDQFNIRKTAERLGVTTSQLVKLLKQLPEAFQMVNQRRVQVGLEKLR